MRDVEELRSFLINELQKMDEIQSTETLVILDHPYSKPLYP
jgi:DNA-binding Lrp family transcriptional regulator